MSNKTQAIVEQDKGTVSATYFQHRVKCLACGLHFVVCSDYQGWPNEGTTEKAKTGYDSGVVYCPECGTPGKKLIYGPVAVEGFIFQAVPGDATGVRVG